jgi:hypothetical protein
MLDARTRLSRHIALTGLALSLLVSASAGILGGHEASAARGHAHARHGVSSERKGTRSRTVTRSFSNETGIAIPEGQKPGGVPANPYPSTITVDGFTRGKIVDLDVTLHGFEHDIPPDVDILLVKESENSPAVQIVGDVGDITHDDVAFITLDDEADEPLPFFERLSAGRFQPTDNDQEGFDDDSFPAPAPAIGPEKTLSAFDGLNPNGTWRLYVVDARNQDGGSIDGWELTMQVREGGKKRRGSGIAGQ